MGERRTKGVRIEIELTGHSRILRSNDVYGILPIHHYYYICYYYYYYYLFWLK